MLICNLDNAHTRLSAHHTFPISDILAMLQGSMHKIHEANYSIETALWDTGEWLKTLGCPWEQSLWGITSDVWMYEVEVTGSYMVILYVHMYYIWCCHHSVNPKTSCCTGNMWHFHSLQFTSGTASHFIVCR